MKRRNPHDADEILALEAGLEELLPLFTEDAQLPESSDLLHRARLRQREVAAERLARWTSRIQLVAIATLVFAAAAAAYALRSSWADWLVHRLLGPLLTSPPLPAAGDAAAMAGAVLALSAAAVWVLQQFAEE